jgi:GT2 family glycosyltransferase
MILLMDLSVIIVNYNVRHFLEHCLISVKKAAERISAEIIVVDNNSSDGSSSMVSSGFPGVTLIRNSNNAGFSAACNQAIKISTGRFILLLNPDTLVEEDTFINCISFMEEHPEAGAVGVQMFNGNGKPLPESKRSLPTPKTAFFKMTGFSRLLPGSGSFNRYYLGHLDSASVIAADVLSGAFMFIRKTALDKTGLLDETYFMYGEDIDLSYRLIQAGYKNYYYPGARIIHYKGESTRKGDVDYVVHFYRAMLVFINRHYSKNEYRPFLILIRVSIYFWGFMAVLKNFFRKYLSRYSGTKKNKRIRKVAVVGDAEVYRKITELVSDPPSDMKVGGRVSINGTDTGAEVLGSLDQIGEVIRVNRIDEVIFSTRLLAVSSIIDSMQRLAKSNIVIKMSPPGENIIIGSNYIREKYFKGD